MLNEEIDIEVIFCQYQLQRSAPKKHILWYITAMKKMLNSTMLIFDFIFTWPSGLLTWQKCCYVLKTGVNYK